MNRIPNIFEYTESGKFLGDYYTQEKSRNASFSLANFCRKADIPSKGFLHNVMKGKRRLTEANVTSIAKAIHLNAHECEYFRNLVAYNKARNAVQVESRLSALIAIKGRDRDSTAPQQFRRDQFEFYSKIHHSAVRALVGLYPFKDDYKWLSRSVVPRITRPQAKRSIKLLEKLGLIRKGKGGYYRLTRKTVTSGEDVKSLALRNLHIQAAGLVPSAIRKFPADKRNVTGLTLGISQQTYEKICGKLFDIRMEILRMAEKDESADRVYRLNLQLFPMAKAGITKGRVK